VPNKQQFGHVGRVFLVDLHGKSMENHGKSMLLFELNHVEPTKNMALTCFGKVFSLEKNNNKTDKTHG
jgi:hypothetical protein